jgi:DNA invertase Pin-like site-specific DNA recombinase
MLVGYARVSSTGQSLDVQLEALSAAGCEKIFAEKKSGRSTVERQQLSECIDFVREGDTLVVTRLDRLARSVGDLFSIVERLGAKRVAFKCLQQSGVDTDTSGGRLMLAVLGAVAAFEADIRRERQMEGISKAKAAGVYKGRKPSVDRSRVRSLRANGMSPTLIAKELQIARASVYRALQGGQPNVAVDNSHPLTFLGLGRPPLSTLASREEALLPA